MECHSISITISFVIGEAQMHRVQANLSLILFLVFCPAFAHAQFSDYGQTADPGDNSAILSWSPDIKSPRRVRALSVAPWFDTSTYIDELSGKDHQKGFWLISTSLEDAYYRPAVP
ncbi:MAG: hypothetical protein ACKO0V_17045, partial [bacterium]